MSDNRIVNRPTLLQHQDFGVGIVPCEVLVADRQRRQSQHWGGKTMELVGPWRSEGYSYGKRRFVTAQFTRSIWQTVCGEPINIINYIVEQTPRGSDYLSMLNGERRHYSMIADSTPTRNLNFCRRGGTTVKLTGTQSYYFNDGTHSLKNNAHTFDQLLKHSVSSSVLIKAIDYGSKTERTRPGQKHCTVPAIFQKKQCSTPPISWKTPCYRSSPISSPPISIRPKSNQADIEYSRHHWWFLWTCKKRSYHHGFQNNKTYCLLWKATTAETLPLRPDNFHYITPSWALTLGSHQNPIRLWTISKSCDFITSKLAKRSNETSQGFQSITMVLRTQRKWWIMTLIDRQTSIVLRFQDAGTPDHRLLLRH